MSFLINLFLAVLSFHCCAWGFSSCRRQGMLSCWGEHRLCGAQASEVAARRLSNCGSWALVACASVVQGLWCPGVCEIFPYQELNLSLIGKSHWQVDSQLLDYQGTSGGWLFQHQDYPFKFNILKSKYRMHGSRWKERRKICLFFF